MESSKPPLEVKNFASFSGVNRACWADANIVKVGEGGEVGYWQVNQRHSFGPLTIQPQKIPTQAKAKSVYKRS
jgi:hypothetical protein